MRFLPRKRSEQAARGQTLVEFALVLPILVLILLGIVQFGLLFWAQITLTQVARDTGRWAATQTTCGSGAFQGEVLTEANQIAGQSNLFGYTTGGITGTAVASWASGTDIDCPPEDNESVWRVDIHLEHSVPVFLPMVANGCAGDCRSLDSDVQYRMEPTP